MFACRVVIVCPFGTARVLIDDDDGDDDDGIVRSDGGTGRDLMERWFCISIGLPIGDWVACLLLLLF